MFARADQVIEDQSDAGREYKHSTIIVPFRNLPLIRGWPPLHDRRWDHPSRLRDLWREYPVAGDGPTGS